MRILVDLDCICADFLGALLAIYNKETGESVTVAHIDDYNMCGVVNNPELLEQIFRRPGFFRQLPLIPGAAESLRELQKHDEVAIVTAPCTSLSAAEKYDWVEEHLPFIGFKNTWIGNKKYQLLGDVLIDDSPKNVAAYRQHHPTSLILTIGYEYTCTCPHYNAVCGSYHDFEKAWERIVQTIKDHTEIDF